MAMRPDQPARRQEDPGSSGVRRATTILHSYDDPRWVEVADGVLGRVMSARRRSLPVLAQTRRGSFRVSEAVLRQRIQEALDPVQHCEVDEIAIHLAGQTFIGVTLIVTVQFPYPIIAIADELRGRARACLAPLLGQVTPQVTVDAMHVHVEDVTPGNPKIG